MANVTQDDQTVELLKKLIETNQDLFILHALSAGVRGEAVRKFLHVDNWRVSNVSKILKTRKGTE